MKSSNNNLNGLISSSDPQLPACPRQCAHKAIAKITRTLKGQFISGILTFFIKQLPAVIYDGNRHCCTNATGTHFRSDSPLSSGLPSRLLWEMFTKRLFWQISLHMTAFWEVWGTRNLLLAFNRRSNHPPTTRINFIKMLTRRPKYSTRKPCLRPLKHPSIDWSQRQFMNLSPEFSARTFFMTDARRRQH